MEQSFQKEIAEGISPQQPRDEKDTISGQDKEIAQATSSSPTATSPTSETADVDLEKDGALSSAGTKDGTDDEKKEPDPNTVDWSGPEDPDNPLNWAPARKWSCIAAVSASSFVTPLGSSFFAPAVPLVMEDFGSSNTLLASFVVSVYLLGFCFGPLFIAPMSEVYGRSIVYHVSNVFFVIFSICCAVSINLPMFIIFRFMMGVAGVTPLTIGGGTVADLVPLERRGSAMAIWSMGPLMGPVIGPVAGGYLSQAAGWRWVFYVMTITAAVLTVFLMIVLRETYAPVLLERKARKLRAETGNQDFRSKYDSGLTSRDHFKRAIVRPTKLFCKSPIVFLMTLYMSIGYGYLYLVFTTITYVFEGQYGFTTGQAGLTFLGMGMGLLVGLILMGKGSDMLIARAKRLRGANKPEDRLPPVVLGAICMPIGLFWYGWSAQAHTHWIVPIIGSAFIGLGLMGLFMPITVYLIDAFTLYAASVTAANTIVRSLFGALLPLAGQDMYAALGLGGGNSLLAGIALLLLPVPFVFMRYGERIRTAKRFQVKL